MTTVWEHYEDKPATLTVPVDLQRDHVVGPEDAPVSLVEYGDYQCPYCGQAHPVVAALLEAVPKLQYVFRHFPLTTVHPRAEPAAEAAEAAGAQGQFWQMHDLLFSHQERLDEADLLAYAQALGLQERRYVRDLVERVHAPRVREDFISGVRSGVNGTPTFFVNGVRHNGGFDFQSLLAAVESAAAVTADR